MGVKKILTNIFNYFIDIIIEKCNVCAVYLATVMTLSDYSIEQGTILDTISYLKLLLSESQYAYNTRRSLTFAAIQKPFDFTGDNIYKIDLQLVIKKAQLFLL